MRKPWIATSILLASHLSACGEVPLTEEPQQATIEEDVAGYAQPLEEVADLLGVESIYLLEGDILVTNPEAFATRVMSDVTLGDAAELGDDKLLGHAIPGRPNPTNVNDMVRWDGRRWRLTYCIANDWAPYNKKMVIDAMTAAGAAWEYAGVDFIYRPEYDYRCQDTVDEVMFRVIMGPAILGVFFRAAAFLPDADADARTVIVTFTALDPEYLEPNEVGYTLPRILTHELGHILGFRHEHIREGTTCSEEPEPWIPLTSLDRHSIMYYPYCNPNYTPSPSILTSLDRAGAVKAYPKDPNPTLSCGDGLKQSGEACDDGNAVGNDGCSDGCLAVESHFVCDAPGLPCRVVTCGNGVLDVEEDCDGTPGCPSTCEFPTYDPARPNSSFCSAGGYRCGVGEGDCDTDAECGAGLVCGHDIGDMYGLPSTWDVCVRNAVCPVFAPFPASAGFCNYPGCDCQAGQGDCDLDSDCAAGLYCRQDVGPAYGMPVGWDVCVRAVCGNGNVEPTETCDDGNTQSGDGCSSTCKIDPNVCGNGVVGPGEECDDGNNRANDGCFHCVEDPFCNPHIPSCQIP